MPQWAYSVTNLDPDRTVKCSGREYRISAKSAVEVCRTIKGMRLADAKKLLEKVIAKERPITFRRYKGEVAHRSHEERFYAGKYPVKVADKLLKLLEELESNAEYKGLDIEKLRISHAAAHRGRKLRKFIPRAYGRGSPSFQELCHVELVGFEAQS